MAELAGAAALVQNRDFELEHEQRYHDREHAIAEGLNSSETKLALSETLQQIR
jgi:hypothetical protein